MLYPLLESSSIHVAISIYIQALTMHFVLRPTAYIKQHSTAQEAIGSNRCGLRSLVRLGYGEGLIAGPTFISAFVWESQDTVPMPHMILVVTIIVTAI